MQCLLHNCRCLFVCWNLENCPSQQKVVIAESTNFGLVALPKIKTIIYEIMECMWLICGKINRTIVAEAKNSKVKNKDDYRNLPLQRVSLPRKESSFGFGFSHSRHPVSPCTWRATIAPWITRNIFWISRNICWITRNIFGSQEIYFGSQEIYLGSQEIKFAFQEIYFISNYCSHLSQGGRMSCFQACLPVEVGRHHITLTLLNIN